VLQMIREDRRQTEPHTLKGALNWDVRCPKQANKAKQGHPPKPKQRTGVAKQSRIGQAELQAMGYCMTTHHDTGVSMSPKPPQDGSWAIFVPASYKNMTLGEAELSIRRRASLWAWRLSAVGTSVA
jgi:hypothetical protein